MPQIGSRVLVNPRLALSLDHFAAEHGSDVADLVELSVTATGRFGDDSRHAESAAAARLLERFASDDTQSLDDIRGSLERGVTVGILRLGAPRGAEIVYQGGVDEPDVPLKDLPIEHLPGGYPRRSIGMMLTDSPAQVWSSARGYWRMNPTEYLAPCRYGQIPHVFRVDEWDRTDTEAARAWARHGCWIDLDHGEEVHLREPRPGSHAHSLGRRTPATDLDLDVARTLTARPIRLGPRGTNPVIPVVGD